MQIKRKRSIPVIFDNCFRDNIRNVGIGKSTANKKILASRISQQPFSKRVLNAVMVAPAMALLAACQSGVITNETSDTAFGEGFLPKTVSVANDVANGVANNSDELPQASDSNSNESVSRKSHSKSKLVPGRDLTLAALPGAAKKSWSKRGGDIELNFSNISVADAAQLILTDQLGKSFTIDNDVSGSLSLNGQGGLDQTDLVPTFQVLLSSVDAKLVQEGEGYRIVRGADKRSVHSTKDLDIIPLRYMNASTFAEVLANHGVSAAVIDDGNMVAVNAPLSKLKKIRGLAKTFDVNWLKGQSIGFYPIENGSAAELRADLLNMFAAGDVELIGAAKLVVINRTNSLVVVAPSEAAVSEVGRWISQLDQQSSESNAGFYVYRVKNGKATELAELASKMFNANRAISSEEQLVQPIAADASEQQASNANSKLRIIADDATNSVIVSGRPYHFRLVKDAMKELDTKPLQVLVEARIMELSLTGELTYGLEWFLRGSRASSNTDGSLDFDQAGADFTVPGFNYVVERAGEISGVLNAFADDSRLKVLSSPSLLVLNNRTARIQVGDEVPIPRVQSTSNFAPGAPTVNTIDYRDTGIVLEITPRINAGGMVTLDVTQEVSSVGRNTVSEIDAPIIQQRKLSSTIAVQNGQTVVLGGLIQERASTSDAGVPVLKNIPGVGKLFSSSAENTRRTELVALLTPKVVERQEDFARINQDYIESFRGLKEIQLND